MTKYLTYLYPNDDQHRAGLMHNLANLIDFIREAISLSRIPVIPVPCFDWNHNFGVQIDCEWSKYFCLEETKVYSPANILIEPECQTQSFRYILNSDFKNLNFPVSEVARIDPFKNGADSDVCKKTVLVRELTSDIALWGQISGSNATKYDVRLNYSDQVVNLARLVTNQITPYIALHVRRGDRLRLNRRYNKHTKPAYIARFLLQNFHQVPNVFLMSDERKPDFFDSLKRNITVFTYKDFADLSTLIQGLAPDNFMLFCVEKKIYYDAYKRIGTFIDSDSANLFLSPYSMNDLHLSFPLFCYGLIRKIYRRARGGICLIYKNRVLSSSETIKE